MGGFRFELEAVLRQREHAERVEQVAMGTIDRERLALEAELGAAQGEIEDEQAELRRRLVGARFATVRDQALAVGVIERRAAGIARRLAETLERLEKARERLVRASADRRAIELLRERRYETWRREQLRKEQRTLDDVVSGASARRAQEAA